MRMVVLNNLVLNGRGESIQIHNCDSVTANGTWIISSGSNLAANTTYKQEGTAGLYWDVTTNSSCTELYNSTIIPVDLAVYEYTGKIRFWLYLSSVTNLNYIVVDWGNDVVTGTNYWEFDTLTTNYLGNPLAVGWNLMEVDWAHYTDKDGSPDASITNAFQISLYFTGNNSPAGLFCVVDDIEIYNDLPDENYSVTEIAFDNAPVLALNTLEIAREDGSKLISANYAAKEITITGMIKGTSQNDLDDRLDDFKKAISGTGLNLDIIVNQRRRRWVVETSAIQIGDPRLTYQITFIPYTLTLMACDPPFGQDTIMSEAYSAEGLTLLNETFSAVYSGTAKPKPTFSMRCDVVGTLDEIQLKNVTTNTEIDIHTAWSNNDFIEIDTDKKTVQKNFNNIGFDGIFPENNLGLNNYLMSFLASNSIDQEQSVTEGNGQQVSTSQVIAQGFKVSATTNYNRIDLLLRTVGSPTGNFTLEIQSDSGGDPSDSVLATCTITPSDVSSNMSWITFNFSSNALTLGTQYHMVAHTLNSGYPNCYYWLGTITGPYADGVLKKRLFDVGSWTTFVYPPYVNESCFKVYSSANVANQSVDVKIDYYRRYL